MMNRKGFRYAPGLLLAGTAVTLALSNGGCSAANTIAGAAQGCDEFSGGSSSIASLSIDGTTKAFVQASSDFSTVVSTMENSIYTACKGIDTDFMLTDTWSAKTGLDAQMQEACTQAQTKITAVLNAGAMVQASCALSITGGGCQVSADVEASCEGGCTGAANCTPPDITVACTPAELSGQCSGTCNASATCEGTVMAAATCQGSCSADCSGECDVSATTPKVHCEGTCAGNCTGTCDGTAIAGTAGAMCTGKCAGTCDANCTYTGGATAHCDGSCKGTCTGDCKLDATANVMCGASVNCKGGCTGTLTAPTCEGEITPPMCNVDANCQASCQGHAEATATCTPPTATLECDANATADMQTLVTTVQKNLPALLLAVQTQGPLAVKAGAHVVATGSAVVSAAASLGGKAIACAGSAVTAAASASVSVNVSVMASASVSGSCGGPMSGS